MSSLILEMRGEEMMTRVANAIGCGVSTSQIHSLLMSVGMDENDAYLVYAAGKILASHRKR